MKCYRDPKRRREYDVMGGDPGKKGGSDGGGFSGFGGGSRSHTYENLILMIYFPILGLVVVSANNNNNNQVGFGKFLVIFGQGGFWSTTIWWIWSKSRTKKSFKLRNPKL
eukprot:UN22169